MYEARQNSSGVIGIFEVNLAIEETCNVTFFSEACERCDELNAEENKMNNSDITFEDLGEVEVNRVCCEMPKALDAKKEQVDTLSKMLIHAGGITTVEDARIVKFAVQKLQDEGELTPVL